MKLRRLLTTSCGALALLSTSAIGAQAQDSGSTNADGGLDTIIVTAQRVEQSLQDTSVAVEAFDQESLTRDGLESAKDLGSLSPALGISAGGGPLTSIFVRGVGALSVNPLSETFLTETDIPMTGRMMQIRLVCGGKRFLKLEIRQLFDLPAIMLKTRLRDPAEISSGHLVMIRDP